MKKQSYIMPTLPVPQTIEVPSRECLIQTIVASLQDKKNYWVFLDDSFLEDINHSFSSNRIVIDFDDKSIIEIIGTSRCPWRKYCCPWHEVTNIQARDFIFESCEIPAYCLFFKPVNKDN